MELSHVDENGAKMVDVGEKSATKRTAVARGKIKTKPETIILLTNKETPKGDVLNTARVAGIMAAKNTSSLIPMCHNVPLDNVKIEFEIRSDKVLVTATAVATYKTGVEMEALVAVSVASLTIYDMLKAVDKSMVIGEICLLKKEGGKSGIYERV